MINYDKHKTLWQFLDKDEQEDNPPRLLSDFIQPPNTIENTPSIGDNSGLLPEQPVPEPQPVTAPIPDDTAPMGSRPQQAPVENKRDSEIFNMLKKVGVDKLEGLIPGISGMMGEKTGEVEKAVAAEGSFGEYLEKNKDGTLNDYLTDIAKPKRDMEYEKRKKNASRLNMLGKGLLLLSDANSLHKGGLAPDRTGYKNYALDSYNKMLEDNVANDKEWQQVQLKNLEKNYNRYLLEKDRAEAKGDAEAALDAERKWREEQAKVAWDRQMKKDKDDKKWREGQAKPEKEDRYTGLVVDGQEVVVNTIEGRTLADAMMNDPKFLEQADIKTIMAQYQNNPAETTKSLVTGYMSYLQKQGKLGEVIDGMRKGNAVIAPTNNTGGGTGDQGGGTAIKSNSGREYSDEFLKSVISLSKQPGITKQIIANKLREIDPTLTDNELIELLRPL